MPGKVRRCRPGARLLRLPRASRDERAEQIRRLKSGELQVLFARGSVQRRARHPRSTPCLFLRPPRARSCSWQQLGRGPAPLPLAKSCLTVLDFIGQAHRRFPRPPLPRPARRQPRQSCAKQIEAGFPLPPRRLQPPARSGVLHGSGCFQICANRCPAARPQLLGPECRRLGACSLAALLEGLRHGKLEFLSGGGRCLGVAAAGVGVGQGQPPGAHGGLRSGWAGYRRRACASSRRPQAPALAGWITAGGRWRPIRRAFDPVPSASGGCCWPSSGAMPQTMCPSQRRWSALGRRRHSRPSWWSCFALLCWERTDLPGGAARLAGSCRWRTSPGRSPEAPRPYPARSVRGVRVIERGPAPSRAARSL